MLHLPGLRFLHKRLHIIIAELACTLVYYTYLSAPAWLDVRINLRCAQHKNSDENSITLHTGVVLCNRRYKNSTDMSLEPENVKCEVKCFFALRGVESVLGIVCCFSRWEHIFGFYGVAHGIESSRFWDM